MADGKYSIDDILNEYSGTTTGGGSSDIDVDAIIGGFDKPSASALHNEPEIKAVESAAEIPIPTAAPVPALEKSDSFEEKYAKFASAVTAGFLK